MAIHMCAQDIHLIRPSTPHLSAINLFPRARLSWLPIQFSEPFIWLQPRAIGYSCSPCNASLPRTSRAHSEFTTLNYWTRRFTSSTTSGRSPRRGVELIMESFCLTTITFQLFFNPIHCRSITIGPLPSVTELGQSF